MLLLINELFGVILLSFVPFNDNDLLFGGVIALDWNNDADTGEWDVEVGNGVWEGKCGLNDGKFFKNWLKNICCWSPWIWGNDDLVTSSRLFRDNFSLFLFSIWWDFASFVSRLWDGTRFEGGNGKLIPALCKNLESNSRRMKSGLNMLDGSVQDGVGPGNPGEEFVKRLKGDGGSGTLFGLNSGWWCGAPNIKEGCWLWWWRWWCDVEEDALFDDCEAGALNILLSIILLFRLFAVFDKLWFLLFEWWLKLIDVWFISLLLLLFIFGSLILKVDKWY